MLWGRTVSLYAFAYCPLLTLKPKAEALFRGQRGWKELFKCCFWKHNGGWGDFWFEADTLWCICLMCVRLDFPREVVPVVLSSLIYPEIPDFPLNRLIQDSDIMSANMVMTTARVFLFLFLCRSGMVWVSVLWVKIFKIKSHMLYNLSFQSVQCSDLWIFLRNLFSVWFYKIIINSIVYVI